MRARNLASRKIMSSICVKKNYLNTVLITSNLCKRNCYVDSLSNGLVLFSISQFRSQLARFNQIVLFIIEISIKINDEISLIVSFK